MAKNTIHIDAPPEAVFDVLADPRSYAHWVVGSREIRGADAAWPAVGTRFDHSVGYRFLRVRDHTVVEDVRRPEFLKILARARPLGSARITVELRPEPGGTHVTMEEHPGDALTAFVFTPLTHLLMRGRNTWSLERLKALAEGRAPVPAGPLPTRAQAREGKGRPIPSPRDAGERVGLGPLPWIGRGLAAGVAGSVAMSVSTNAEMRLRGRPPSRAPAHALRRLLGRRRLRRIGEGRVVTAAHVATGVGLGGVRGLLRALGVGDRAARPLFLAMSLTPDVAIVPALGAAAPPWRWGPAGWAVTLLHHGVYAAATTAAFEALGRRA